MKLYEYEAFPNPRRVRIFLAEKGLEVEREQIDVPGGAHRQDDFLKKNPFAGVPVLELDDGSHLGETTAISRYFEALKPSPALMGTSPQKIAEVDMWQRRIEQGLLDKLLAYFHHATPGLGELETYQNADWGHHCRESVTGMLEKLEQALEGRDYIAGEFSVADITALCALDLAAFLEFDLPEDLVNVRAWHARLAARPSARA
ncbi:glutathione S-transferase family protein [Rhodovibrionaceae bacterium A322]